MTNHLHAAAVVILILALASPARADYVSDILALNPTAYWRLEGGFTDTAPPGAHSLVPGGGLAFTPFGGGAPLVGYPGNQAGQFDGVNDLATAPSLAGVDFTAAATLLAWVRFDQLPSQADKITAIVAKPGIAKDLDLQAEEDNRFHFYVATGFPNLQVVSNTVIQTDQWYFLAATYAANDRIRLYVNGQLESTLLIPGVTRQENSNAFVVGASTVHPDKVFVPGPVPGRFFPGAIDEVAVINRALDEAEIGQLYQSATLAVHEPSTLLTFGFGALGLAVYLRRRQSEKRQRPAPQHSEPAPPC